MGAVCDCAYETCEMLFNIKTKRTYRYNNVVSNSGKIIYYKNCDNISISGNESDTESSDFVDILTIDNF